MAIAVQKITFDELIDEYSKELGHHAELSIGTLAFVKALITILNEKLNNKASNSLDKSSTLILCNAEDCIYNEGKYCKAPIIDLEIIESEILRCNHFQEKSLAVIKTEENEANPITDGPICDLSCPFYLEQKDKHQVKCKKDNKEIKFEAFFDADDPNGAPDYNPIAHCQDDQRTSLPDKGENNGNI